MSWREKGVGAAGLALAALGLALNERAVAVLSADGQVDSRSLLLLLRAFNVTAVLLGGSIFLLRRRRAMVGVLASLVIALGSLLFFDWCLYLLSPSLPERVVFWMSPQARMRHWRARPGEGDWLFEGSVHYLRPGAETREYGFVVRADSLGYRNPVGYLADAHQLDIVLLGDSCVWGTQTRTIADFLREEMSPLRVYSLGMGGEGIPQWKHHYERFVASTSMERAPHVVVLNFYSGNDVSDTNVYLGCRRADGTVDAAEYFAYLYHQYLIPLRRRSWIPKLPEFYFLAAGVVGRQSQAHPVRYRDLGGLSIPVCLHHKEPSPDRLTLEVLSALASSIQAVREATPGSQVVLSYVATSGGIYGDLMDACPDYAADIGKQEAVSELLSGFCAGLGVTYVDVVPDLRRMAREKVLWAENDHFSLEGYRQYALLLARQLRPLAAGRH